MDLWSILSYHSTACFIRVWRSVVLTNFLCIFSFYPYVIAMHLQTARLPLLGPQGTCIIRRAQLPILSVMET